MGRVNNFCRGKSLLLAVAEGLISNCISVILGTEHILIFQEVWTSYLTKGKESPKQTVLTKDKRESPQKTK